MADIVTDLELAVQTFSCVPTKEPNLGRLSSGAYEVSSSPRPRPWPSSTSHSPNQNTGGKQGAAW